MLLSYTQIMSQSEMCVSVWDWLSVLHLEQYSEVFRNAGLVTLPECRNLTPDQLDKMGITLPGHQRRILASLHKTHLPHASTHSETHPERVEGEMACPKPLPRDRPVPEESIETGERKPVPNERPATVGAGKDGERDGRMDGEKEKPVPKERTKYRTAPPLDFHPNPLLSPTSDPPLPPIPPRSMPNCPPQRFTSTLSPSSPSHTPTSPKLDRRVAQAPAVPSRSPPHSSTTTPTHSPLHPPTFPPLQTRPQTLAFQQGTGDTARKTSPVSPITSLVSTSSSLSFFSAETGEDRSAPPLPPKSGAGPKAPPPIPRRLPVQPARSAPSHSCCVCTFQEVYSKRIISTAFITNVSSVGELKFEVVTHNRTFLFKAESEAERNAWVAVLQDCTKGRQRSSIVNPLSPLTPDYQGYLELRGLRSKLYTVVVSDKVFLYKNMEDYRIGVGITSIDMNVGNVKETDRRSFDLTTPYRIFSFIAESEQLKDQWVEAMREAIGEALSNSEVVERIWAVPSNGYCADCRAVKPEWAAINLCVVVCKRCAGEHRGLGPSISKVRSLKMDRKVWTEELIQVFLLLGNERVNSFWAANVPPSEALSPSSCSDERRRFITNKYRHGKYRKYHPLYGNQKELNNALCINVQCSDVLETLSLVFCGADVNCSTGVVDCPSPLSLASAHSQPLQAEFLSHNLNTELPRSEVGGAMEAVHYSAPPSVSYNGFLFKTGSMQRPPESKAREEFSRRWCTLNDGCFSYYESDKNSNPNGSLKAAEIVCLAVNTPMKHGYDHTFELYSNSERLYLFGTDDEDSHKEWVKSIAKTFIPANVEPLLRLSFERIGRLKYKDGLNLQTPKVGWFALVGSTLHAYLEDSQGEEIHLRKLQELSIQQDNVLVLVERGRTLYIEGERKLDFGGWCAAIQRAAGSGGDTLSQQQLTDKDIPVIVHSCIEYITQHGLTSEGIYRKSGVNSRVAALCEAFRCDARSVHLREGEHQVDDVSNTLKRFFRESGEVVFTSNASREWLSTEESKKISQYQLLLSRLPRVNQATLEALVNHLYCVQRFSELNQMNIHNLAIVFGPTLFQADGKDYTAGRVIEDLIQHYTHIFEVDEQQLKRQLDEITAIIKLHEKLNNKIPGTVSGHFICTVYLEEKNDTAEQHVKIPGSMTAAELTCDILDRRKIPVKENNYWSCWEVSEKDETERLLHHQERVLPIFHSLGTDSYLLIKKHLAMEAMTVYLASKVDVSKHGIMKYREERSIPVLGLSSGSFNDRYFILSAGSLRMYKEVRSNRPERDWPVKNLKVYLGIKKKLRPPTCWGLTVVYESKKQDKPERQQWYLCCDTQSDMREWFATFLSIQYDGDVWPVDGLQQTRMSRVLDTHHGNVSLIPLHGSENEMRNSVAAFSQDLLANQRHSY
uniref:ArfGAP with RhoGAP domain, ankyrin repeat and PH domain 1 n=1 Tax=Myripristis murdjan TaxID=586833 RepID=A0A667ZXB1_9TELE